MTRRTQRGFTLIELMVTIAVIAIMMAIAVPSFGSGVKVARERSVVQRLTQDFMWARGAAAAADASSLGVAGVTSTTTPTLTLVVKADCTWTTAVNGTTDARHSMTSTALAAIAPSASCTGSMALPATFTFTSQGFVNNSGTFTFTGASTTAYPLQILYSGAIFRTNGSQS